MPIGLRNKGTRRAEHGVGWRYEENILMSMYFRKSPGMSGIMASLQFIIESLKACGLSIAAFA
jgi:hypothetical protein